ncbi:hypothetical protein ASD11_03650 [Aeromicrobium sp. Root495]|uniref:hypothetical protein n=1 Tax=Aeromicrobium sp. Root495 TaxID=1736550 RepID=UPI0006FC8E89|nr:hypothetical protein [Aeromicrobium sp. Root495]KQY58748.1 hypothetical protein ASD11_03650 [Aeromicrobium sp. Root495]
MGLFSRRRPSVSVRYVARAADADGLDQQVFFTNGSEACLRPTLRFEPLDPYGRVLPHVEVGSVLGIDRGELVAPPGSEISDVLHFHGQGARLVRAVRIGASSIEEVDLPDLTQPVEVLMVDLSMKATLDPEEFWGVGVANPNDTPVSVSITLVELEDERPGDDLRQAVDAVTLQQPVDLASRGHDVVWLPEETRGRFHTVLGHVVVPWVGPPELEPPTPA